MLVLRSIMVSNDSRSSQQPIHAGPDPASPGGPASRHIAASTSELSPLRAWLQEHLADVADTDRRMLLVAVTEAATNAIEAHLRHGVDRPIEVVVDRGGGVITIEDHGGGIDEAETEEPVAPGPSAARGRGLLIIRSVCPDARFVATGTGVRTELPYTRS
jgi:anti-sigma regulatory factor (Ser/Thr protein kinase)